MLDEIIKQASDELISREKVRDEAYSKARKARTLSKQAILFLHSGETENSKTKLSEAKYLIKVINEYSNEHSEIAYFEAVKASKQEFAEANILYAINTGIGYPSFRSTAVNFYCAGNCCPSA